MRAAVKNILVIGGGYSGVSAAIQLSKVGMKVDLLEIDPSWRPLGAGISLSAPAIRAFDTLGIYEAVKREGYLSKGLDIYAADGQFIAQLPTPSAVGEKEYPGGGGIMRPVLARILSEATRDAGVNVRLGYTFESIEQRDESVVVRFSNGDRAEYDLVVGADGVHSSVRTALFPEAPAPKPINQSVWRAVLPRPAEIERPSIWIADIKVGVNPISNTHMYMFINEHRDFHEHIDPAKWADEMAGLLRDFSAPVLQSLIEELYKPEANIDYRPLANLLVPLPWHKGRVIMIGDAVHSTTPHLAAGAGIGIESAIVLAEELATASDLETALRRVESRRWERCRMVVENSARLCEIEKSGGSKDEHAQIMRDSLIALSAPI